MTTPIKSVDQATTQFKRNLIAGSVAIDKSHVALVWAILNAIEDQDLSALDTMRAMVADVFPVLVSRFDDYVLATLDGVTLVAGAYDDDGDTFELSKCAELRTPWNVKKRLAKPSASDALDIRADIARAVAKMARAAKGKVAVVDQMKGTNGQHIADILANAQAAIEAVYAGTYAAPAVINNSDVQNVTPIKKSRSKKAA